MQIALQISAINAKQLQGNAEHYQSREPCGVRWGCVERSKAMRSFVKFCGVWTSGVVCVYSHLKSFNLKEVRL